MSSVTPITQRDVAKACRLHPSTVCLALKNSPSIPMSTRRRVHAVAERLGYSPNVAARNLALLRSDRRGATRLPIAWMNQEARRDHWRSDEEARVYFEAARRRADEVGYHLEEIWTREPGMNAARIVQILAARGIEGVLFPAHRGFDFSLLNRAWNDFAMVGIGDHRLGEWLDVVCPDYYRDVDLALRRLRQLGFAKPGLVVTAQFDRATNGLVRSCYVRHQSDAPDPVRMPVCLAPAEEEAGVVAVIEWVREHGPDVVLCHDRALMQAARLALPDVEWVQLHASVEAGNAGVDTAAADVASLAVDCVVDKIRRFEKGFREATRFLAIKGVWQEGRLAARELESVVA